MEVDVKEDTEKPPEKPSRKRRRSEMEEAAVITIMESQPKEKKKKGDNEGENKANGKNESQTPANSTKEEPKATKEGEAKEKPESPPVKTKDNEPSSSTPEKEKDAPKLTPIRLVISANQKRVVAKTTGRGSPKVLPIKIRQTKLDKSIVITKVKPSKDEKIKSQKRRNSKGNKSLNGSTASEKADKTEKKTEKTTENEKSKDNKEASTNKNKDDANKSTSEKANPSKANTGSPKSKERIQFDDDTSLAEIARGANKTAVTNSNVPGLPTISSVRSLSTTAQNTSTTNIKSTTSAKMIEVTIEPGMSLLTPTSSDSAQNVKETTKTSEPSMVGRVGVRAFARMASPEPQKNKEVEVEIKAEPIDFEDHDRQLEKLDMMKAFRLRPVSQAAPASSLREVRINKVVMTPLNARKTATKTIEVRPRARKTFPQPKKPDDGRSELNSKNSMVYIPIQPPMTPGPLRVRPAVSTANGSVAGTPGPRPTAPIITTTRK